MVRLTQKGVPVLFLVTDEFYEDARAFAAKRGLAEPGLVRVPTLAGYCSEEEVGPFADQAVAGILALLGRAPQAAAGAAATAVGAAAGPEPSGDEGDLIGLDPTEADALFTARGWTDGLPIVVPTPERVAAFVRASGREAGEAVAVLPPREGVATVACIAANAVMAGCRPEHMPLLLAVVAALGDEAFGLASLQTANHSAAPLVIVSGPAARALGVDAGGTTRPDNWNGNRVLSRAVRLLQRNIATFVGITTMGDLGVGPSVVAEYGEGPWEPLHVSRGFAPEDSTVTVVATEPPHLVDDQGSTTAQAVLTTVAMAMSIPIIRSAQNGGTQTVLLGLDHVRKIAAAGLTRADAQAYLYEVARIRVADLPEGHYFWPSLGERRSRIFRGLPPTATLPVVNAREDFLLAVTGAGGHHSMYAPGFNTSRPVTRRIEGQD